MSFQSFAALFYGEVQNSQKNLCNINSSEHYSEECLQMSCQSTTLESFYIKALLWRIL